MGKALKRIEQASHAVQAMLIGALGAVALNLPIPISTTEAQTLKPSNISDHSTRTRTPIKHLIVVIGENRSFDNVFATYVPADPKQSVWNLLSQGIVNKSGAPGLNAAKALQRQATDQATYQLAPPITGAFSTLPQPSTTLNALPTSPCVLSELLKDFKQNPAGILFCSDIGLLQTTRPCFLREEPANLSFFRALKFFPRRIADIPRTYRMHPIL
jgi:hypothetical protein